MNKGKGPCPNVGTRKRKPWEDFLWINVMNSEVKHHFHFYFWASLYASIQFEPPFLTIPKNPFSLNEFHSQTRSTLIYEHILMSYR